MLSGFCEGAVLHVFAQSSHSPPMLKNPLYVQCKHLTKILTHSTAGFGTFFQLFWLIEPLESLTERSVLTIIQPQSLMLVNH